MNLLYLVTFQKPKLVLKALFFNILFNLVSIFPFILLLFIIEEIAKFGTNHPKKLSVLLILMIFSYFAQYFSQKIQGISTYIGGYKISAKERINLANHLANIPLGSLLDKGARKVTSLLMDDFAIIENALTHIILQFYSSIAFLLIFAVALFAINPMFGALILFGAPLSFVVILISKQISKNAMEKIRLKNIKFSKNLSEFISGIDLFKSLNLDNFATRNLNASIDELTICSKNAEKHINALNSLAIILLKIGLVLFMSFVALKFNDKNVDFDYLQMFMFLLIAPRILAPLEESLLNLSNLSIIKQAAIRIKTINDEKILSGDGEISGTNIILKGVNFAYKDNLIIKNLNAQIKQGSKIGIVGVSGSGKSTILKLLARFYDVNSGEICYDGKDVREISPSKIFDKISFVFQEGMLIDGTIEENIRFGNQSLSHEDVVLAAKTARCLEFIQNLPNGFETQINQNLLSGGEKQRITIARALLKNAPILLLDEPTACLDATNQKEFLQGLDALAKGKSVVLVTHRLQMVKNCDEIWVVNNGEIIERAKHNELIKNGGIYAKMWQECVV